MPVSTHAWFRVTVALTLLVQIACHGDSPSPSSPSPVVTPPTLATPVPQPSLQLNVFAGVSLDGRGSPIYFNRVTAQEVGSSLRETVLTDGNGRWEFRKAAQQVTLTWVPQTDSGLEGERQGITVGPGGQHVITSRKISRVTTVIGGLTFNGTLRVGTKLPLNVKVDYDDAGPQGLTAPLTEIFGTTSHPDILRWRIDQPRSISEVEGLSPGTAWVYSQYWGVRAAPVQVQVLP